jgi:oligosaccharide repeat unit polymerase
VDLLVVLGLMLQALALFLLFSRIGRGVLTRSGAIFILAATAYHGLNEILLWLFPDRDFYRRLVAPAHVSQFVLWISIAILLLTVAYLGALGRPPELELKHEIDWQRTRIRRVFDWRLMLIAVTPLMILTVVGQGYAGGAIVGPDTSQPLQVGAGLALQFLLILIAFASFGIVCRFGRQWLLPVLLVQSAMLAFIGARFIILVSALMLLYALARVGIPAGRKQLGLGLVALLLLALVITSARAAEGRFSTAANGSLRFDFLAAGVTNIGSPDTWDLVAGDFGYRLDGNSFGAMELQALDAGWPPLGITPLVNDVLLAIPSFLNPAKTSSALENRSEKQYAEVYLGLPVPEIYPGVRADILPTQLGAAIGFWGPWGMLLTALVIGVIFGRADRWLLRRLTPSRLLIGAGFLFCVLSYEASWDIYSVTFRGILLLLPLIWLIQGRRSRSLPLESRALVTVRNRT